LGLKQLFLMILCWLLLCGLMLLYLVGGICEKLDFIGMAGPLLFILFVRVFFLALQLQDLRQKPEFGSCAVS
jgi:hypothetical protein